jgi:hypothetical protein
VNTLSLDPGTHPRRTEADVDRAHEMARRSPSAWRWKVVEVTEDLGAPCPIRPGDWMALAQGAEYGRAFAAYPAHPQAQG